MTCASLKLKFHLGYKKTDFKLHFLNMFLLLIFYAVKVRPLCEIKKYVFLSLCLNIGFLPQIAQIFTNFIV